GTVVDGKGQPLAASVTVEYEGYPPELLQAAADGRFRTTWRHPTHCRVRAVSGAGQATSPDEIVFGVGGFAAPAWAIGATTGQSDELTEPREDLRIAVNPRPAPTAV